MKSIFFISELSRFNILYHSCSFISLCTLDAIVRIVYKSLFQVIAIFCLIVIRYSQAVYDGKILPPPPTKPLPLAPGENIYAELGECKKITPENDYLEPIHSSEVDDSEKSHEGDTKQYEGLKEDCIDMAGYEKMHKTQLPDVQTEDTEKSERKDLERRSTTSSAKTPRNDEDEHGYLKMK